MSRTEDNNAQPWRDEDLLRQLYVGRGLSTNEISERWACSQQTVANWLRKHGIPVRGHGSHSSTFNAPKVLSDSGKLRRLYQDDEMTIEEISERIGCGSTTVSRWMDKHGIETREPDPPDTTNSVGSKKQYKSFRTDKEGYEVWSGNIPVHRIAAVAWFGLDKVVGKHIHHKNNIPWDNRESNIEPLTPSEHAKIHASAEHLPDNNTMNLSDSQLNELRTVIDESDRENPQIKEIEEKLADLGDQR